MDRRWIAFAAWATALLLVRRFALPSSSTTGPQRAHAVSVAPLPIEVATSVNVLKRDLEDMAAISFRAEEVASAVAAIQATLTGIEETVSSTKDVVATQTTAQQQVVHHADSFVRMPRRSHIPPMVDDTTFCDQLLNTFPILLGGAVPTPVVEAWCREGTLGDGSMEHLPPGVEDQHLIPFTLLQAFRRVYLAAQFEDRLIRYRELFAPMIAAIEKRHDRMLYNYI